MARGWSCAGPSGPAGWGGIDTHFTNCFLLPLSAWVTRFLALDARRIALGMTLAFFAFAFLFCLQEREGERRETRAALGSGQGLLCGVLLFWSVISLSGVTQFLYSEF